MTSLSKFLKENQLSTKLKPEDIVKSGKVKYKPATYEFDEEDLSLFASKNTDTFKKVNKSKSSPRVNKAFSLGQEFILYLSCKESRMEAAKDAIAEAFMMKIYDDIEPNDRLTQEVVEAFAMIQEFKTGREQPRLLNRGEHYGIERR